jgi:hypothetical protein
MHSYVSPEALDVDRNPDEPNTIDAVELLQVQDLAEVMDVARCPCCRGPLVARMGCGRPYFSCLCSGSDARVN